MKSPGLFTEFFNSERAGGIILIFCTVLSLILSNTGLQDRYLAIWNYEIGGHSTVHWINDGLMTIFFLLIGLELEREVYKGELSTLKKATLPMVAALGGMLVPAGLYLLINIGTPMQSGIGIPMATDIAFAIGILSLLGSRVPLSLKIFLTALAVIDDLGAILVIALFYSAGIVWINLLLALGIFCILLIMNRLKVMNLMAYLIGGFIMWYFMLHSGVHATISGVLLAFAIPFGTGGRSSISYQLQHWLHKPVAFFIMPVFALANTCIVFEADWYKGLLGSNSLGIYAGLIAGKPLGIFLFSFAAVAAGMCALPKGIHWKHIFGVGFLGGIGFTMSIFITLLAFDNAEAVNSSKVAILAASAIAGITGYIVLKRVLKKYSV